MSLLQTPGPPFIPDEAGKKVNARIIFVQHGATLSSEDNLLMGTRDEAPSTLGDMQITKAAELLMDLKVGFTQPASPFSIAAFCLLHLLCVCVPVRMYIICAYPVHMCVPCTCKHTSYVCAYPVHACVPHTCVCTLYLSASYLYYVNMPNLSGPPDAALNTCFC